MSLGQPQRSTYWPCNSSARAVVPAVSLTGVEPLICGVSTGPLGCRESSGDCRRQGRAGQVGIGSE